MLVDTQPWVHTMPQLCFIIAYMLSAVMCIAVLIMLLWHLWAVARGETSVEAQDHAVYRKIAKDRGEVREFAPMMYLCLIGINRRHSLILMTWGT